MVSFLNNLGYIFVILFISLILKTLLNNRMLRYHMFTFAHQILSYLPAVVSSRIYSLLFFVNLGLGVNVSTPILSSTEKIFNKETIIISSNPNQSNSLTRTIIVIHGLSPSAHRDPRIKSLSKALASANPLNFILIPYIHSLATIDLSLDPCAEIQRFISTVSQDKTLCPSGRISLVSPCISGGMCIVVATKLDCIDSIFTIGAHAHAHNSLQHCISRKGNDDSRYAISGILASFWTPPNPVIQNMLRAYCIDDHYKGLGIESNQLEKLVEHYPEEAHIYNRLVNDEKYLIECMQRIYDHHIEAFKSISPLEHIEHLQCHSISLLHAQTDDIVSPEESKILEKAIKKRGCIHVANTITSLLNHGDKKALAITDLFAIIKLINSCSLFFASGI